MSDSSSMSFDARRLTVFTARIIARVLVILAVAFGVTYFFDEPMRSLARWQLSAVTLAIFGALAATDGWVQHTLVRKRLGGAMTWIIIGAFLAAISPVVSAHGWNEYSDFIRAKEKAAEVAANRSATLRSLAGETIVNLVKLRHENYQEQDKEKLQKPAQYPELRTVVLAEAIVSNQFIGVVDEEVLECLTRLYERLCNMNAAAFDQSHILMSGDIRFTYRDGLRKLRDSAIDDVRKLREVLQMTDKIDFPNNFVPPQMD